MEVETGALSALLQRYRRQAGLTQEELAERAGVSTRSVSDIERGLQQHPHISTLRRLADALGLAPEDRLVFLTARQGNRTWSAIPRSSGPARGSWGQALPGPAADTPDLAAPPTNLPDEPTPFIGREREIAAISTLLQQPPVRLVTLTGSGGVGKTRLALQVASILLHVFRDGIFLVSLASLADPSLVPSVIAQTLGVTEQGGMSLTDTLRDQLHDRRLLLVLDNFEHLLDAAPRVAELLDTCRELHILVTSRIPLHLVREHEYPVPPLSVPDPRRRPSAEVLGQCEAVALLVDRARAMRPDFAITEDNARAVAEICARLDGLPLAIELAATRIKLFPPQALLQRLEHRLQLLTEGARDVPTRQRTLRGAMDWSYNLLGEHEQTLFARLSVFAGGCILEAAEAVCNPDGKLDVLEGLASLVDQSLLRQEGEDEPRFSMLETIREYAAELLEASGEGEMLRQQHASFFLTLVERAAREVDGPKQARWLEELEADHDNLRAVLRWSLERGEPQIGLRLAEALATFWLVRTHWSEGRRWLEEALERGTEVPLALRARALRVAAGLATHQTDYRAAQRWSEESLRLAEQLGDSSERAAALLNLGQVAGLESDYIQEQALYEESLTLYQKLGSKERTCEALFRCGATAWQRGDHPRAEVCLRESLALARELGDTHQLGNCLTDLGEVALAQGELDRAQIHFEDALKLQRQIKDRNCSALSLSGLGAVALERGDPGEARRRLEESMALFEEVGARRFQAGALLRLGGVAMLEGDTEQAEQLCTAGLRIRWQLSDKRGLVSCLEALGEVAQAQGHSERATRHCAAAAA
jgi:predicted ATPase/transcriptional regulator with XRE-family HTH domain